MYFLDQLEGRTKWLLVGRSMLGEFDFSVEDHVIDSCCTECQFQHYCDCGQFVTCVLCQKISEIFSRIFPDPWTSLNLQEFFFFPFKIRVDVCKYILSVHGTVVHTLLLSDRFGKQQLGAFNVKGVIGNFKGKYHGTKLLPFYCYRYVT